MHSDKLNRMNLYARKERWKWLLLVAAVVILASTLWFTNSMVQKVAAEERKNVKLWADAVHRKATLVQYTEAFFKQLQNEERKRVELLAHAYNALINSSLDEELTFYLEIINKNTNIPVVLTDPSQRIINSKNVSFDTSSTLYLSDSLLEEFSVYPPIRVNLDENVYRLLYYKESRLFTELREVLNDLNRSFLDEVVTNSASVPVIITDSLGSLIASGNIDSLVPADTTRIKSLIAHMKDENDPIVIQLGDQGATYIYYLSSGLLNQLRYYPAVQFGIIGLFLLVAYVLFSSARKSEQDQVWVGMSKETAHQLGTPLSSMIAWLELMKMDGIEHAAIEELEKDIKRLETISQRFSKIGSVPKLEPVNITALIYQAIDYLRKRTSRKVIYQINIPENKEVIIPLNPELFEWVVENLVRNAVDAMGGAGRFTIDLSETNHYISIDFTDTGKGIPRSKFKTIFQPGYTSKKRGWGLGLTLVRRIVRSYHNGRIFVRASAPDKGTTFRITLRKP